jgi:transcriptional regulator with XRE-family HTH domain
MDIHIRIKNLRMEMGLTQEELALKLEVHRSTVTNWEATLVPGLDSVVKIADFFAVNIDYLLGRTEARNIGPVYNEEYLLNQCRQLIKNSSVLAAGEQKLIEIFRNCDSSHQRTISLIAKDYAEMCKLANRKTG